MRILYITPSSGDSFYCGNCMRDSLQASSLKRAGHDVVVMPLYLPVKEGVFGNETPLFFPATTFFASQEFFKRRKMPHWLERLTSSKAMLKLASSMAGTTSARGMEGMTLSMIRGEDMAFKGQVDHLINWIEQHDAPQVVHLSTTLLTGIAKAISERLHIPIVCSVQDEEVWIDSLRPGDAQAAWEGIADNMRYINRFIASSNFYKEAFVKRFPSGAKVDVIYPGVNLQKYQSTDYPKEPTIGFFYRMNKANGLELLAKAFIELKRRGTINELKLRIGGGYTREDRRFVKKIKKLLSPFKADVYISESYDREDHEMFYSNVTLISVPITFDEGVGLYLCEAFAAGRPAVEPATGSFAEIVGEAGITYAPNDKSALADALEQMLSNDALLSKYQSEALKLASTRYCDTVLANQLIKTYDNLLNSKK